jgi:hypothetical protein
MGQVDPLEIVSEKLFRIYRIVRHRIQIMCTVFTGIFAFPAKLDEKCGFSKRLR